jgi:RNA polymerase sigma-70 factor (ECF subfamily)
MPKQGDTEQLIDRARAGDRAAFDELVSLTRASLLDRIRREMGRKLRERLEAEDLLQEVLLRAFRSVGHFRGADGKSFRHWLEGIAHNVVRSHGRLQGWKKEIQILRDVPASHVSPSRHQRRQERLERLSRSVEALSPDHRTVIQLCRIEGLKISEVANRMNRSPSAVKNLLLRAVKELRKSFGDTESLGLPDRELHEEGGGGDD